LYLRHQDLSKYLYIDIETDPIPATQIWCAVVKNIGTGELYRLVGKQSITNFIQEAPHDTVWVGHNIISFDVPTVNRLCGTNISLSRVVDTLVLGYLYDARMPGGHSLRAWGDRLKFPKLDWFDFSHYDPEMLVYCERDVDLGIRVFTAITSRMAKRGYSEKSCQLEHDIRVIIDEQEVNGWFFDVPQAEALAARLRDEERRLGDQVHELFPPTLSVQGSYKLRKRADGTPYASYLRHLEQYPKLTFNEDETEYETWDYEEFNIGSPPQRLSKLLTLGFKPTKKTKGGNPSVDEESLVEFSKESGVKEVQMIADWLVVNGRANMITTWLNNVREDSRIHGRVLSCGASSRRMTHSAPNTANIPSNEAKYGHECRELWTVADKIGRRNVGYDSKACQMRCFVSALPDPELGRHFWDTELCADPHKYNADLIGIERKPVKNVFYANMFGAYPPKLAATAGMVGSKRELQEYGEWIQGELYRVTPGLRELTMEAQAEFRQNGGFLSCIDGGYVRCPAENAALNYKIQPAEAVLMKTASVIIRQRLYEKGIEYKKIGDIHDEGQLETSTGQADAVGSICVQAIRDAGEELGFKVPHDGDYKVGCSWAETH
jgi:DNA polymerase-1